MLVHNIINHVFLVVVFPSMLVFTRPPVLAGYLSSRPSMQPVGGGYQLLLMS